MLRCLGQIWELKNIAASPPVTCIIGSSMALPVPYLSLFGSSPSFGFQMLRRRCRSTNKCLVLQPVRAANGEMPEAFQWTHIQIATWKCALGRRTNLRMEPTLATSDTPSDSPLEASELLAHQSDGCRLSACNGTVWGQCVLPQPRVKDQMFPAAVWRCFHWH